MKLLAIIPTGILATATTVGGTVFGTHASFSLFTGDHLSVLAHVLVAWVLMSVPVGVMAGHCTLGED